MKKFHLPPTLYLATAPHLKFVKLSVSLAH